MANEPLVPHSSPPPTPEEIDELLAQVAVYGGECCEIVEDWIEEHFGVVGVMTAEERGIEQHVERPSPGQLVLDWGGQTIPGVPRG